MATRKFMLCQYPSNGFGSKNNQFYLLDVFGNKYDIENEYDKILEQMDKVVRINEYVFTAITIDALIKTIEIEYDTKIVRW